MHARAAPQRDPVMNSQALDILSTRAMAAADRFAMDNGRSGGALMDAAGAGLAKAVMRRWAPRPTAVLCGPGNNGGDGWEAASLLAQAGWSVELFSMMERDVVKGDAARAARKWDGQVQPLAACDPRAFGLVVDALFGAGLSRALEGDAARLAESARDGPILVSADVPSGVDGDLARPLGPSFRADLTVTFHRLKPAHLLQPAAAMCGEVVLIDIGIPDGWGAAAPSSGVINHPVLWSEIGRGLDAASHKHSRGRLCIRSGPVGATGAARLAARAGLVGGAGFVTLLCSEDALPEASKEDAMLVTRAFDQRAEFEEVLNGHRASAAVIGPGGGVTEALKAAVLSALARGGPLVLDADALTVFADAPDTLFEALHTEVVLTPHSGEFSRLFPDLAADKTLNKMEQTREAALRAGCVVLHKGPDTVIAEPGGEVRVNVQGSPSLATAGTGDVLAGLIGAFLAQNAGACDAASAGAWIHGEAGRRSGAGATVETVLAKLPAALTDLQGLQARKAAMQRLNVVGG